MPTGRDAALVQASLRDVGVHAETYAGFPDLIRQVAGPVGAVLIAEEAIDLKMLTRFIEALEAEPIWSDLPVIIFSSHARNAEALLEQLGGRINVTIVERPIRVTMLISAVRG